MKHLIKILKILILVLLLISCQKSESIAFKLKSTNIEIVNQLLNNKQDLILYLGKDSCQACQKFTPILIEASQELELDFYYLEVSQQLDFLNKYNVLEVPALLVVKNNQIYFPQITYNKEQLIKLLKTINPRP